MFGIRQSQWLAKQVELPPPLASRFSVARKVVNSVPLGSVKGDAALQV